MIDPASKRRKLLDSNGKPKHSRRNPPRSKPRLRQAEKIIIGELVKDAPSNRLSSQQIKATAIVLHRTPETIKSVVQAAREKLLANAEHYVQSHAHAMDLAIALNEPDTARKAAEWAIEHISSRDKDGKVERIVEAVQQESTAPRIQIGIALGGIAGQHSKQLNAHNE